MRLRTRINGNSFLCTEHSRVTCFCEVDDDGDVELIRNVEKPPLLPAKDGEWDETAK